MRPNAKRYHDLGDDVRESREVTITGTMCSGMEEILGSKRDKIRFRLKDTHKIDMDTLFGTANFIRRFYLDLHTGLLAG